MRPSLSSPLLTQQRTLPAAIFRSREHGMPLHGRCAVVLFPCFGVPSNEAYYAKSHSDVERSGACTGGNGRSCECTNQTAWSRPSRDSQRHADRGAGGVSGMGSLLSPRICQGLRSLPLLVPPLLLSGARKQE